MVKLKHRTVEFSRERELGVRWGQAGRSSHLTGWVTLSKWLQLSEPQLPPLSPGGWARTPADPRHGRGYRDQRAPPP